MEFFQCLSPVFQASIAGCFTWAMTAVGASFAFGVSRLNQRLLDGALGLAAGVMIAVSFWGLLLPAIESTPAELPAWLPAAAGFTLGGLFLRLVDRFLPHLHYGCPAVDAEGIRAAWRRNTLLTLAMTVHNIPEGLAIGVAFGAVVCGGDATALASALVLALGIGIQNLPEGLAVSVPLRCMGVSRLRSFFWGQLSAVVEPFAALVGAAVVIAVQSIMPYALGFAAGAMIFVVVEEIVPEAQRAGHRDIVAGAFLAGFLLMTVLDTALA